jgi:HEAT repeat protein
MRLSIAIAAVSVLGLLNGQAHGQAGEIVKQLIAKLKDRDEAVRLKAAKDLGKLKAEAKDAIPALTRVASGDADEDVRAVAKKAVEAIRDAVERDLHERLNEVLDPLVRALKGKNAEERISAIDKLGDLGSQAKQAGEALVQYGVLDRSPAIRDAAGAAFEKIDPEVHKHIVSVLYDAQEYNKRQAISALKTMGRKAQASMPALKFYYRKLTTDGQYNGAAAGHALDAMVHIHPEDKAVIDTVLGLVSMPVIPRGSRTQLPDPRNFPDRRLAITLLTTVKTDSKNKVKVLIAALADPLCRAQAVAELVD